MAFSVTGMLSPGGRVSIPLDQRAEHAAALGRFLGHWAFLETQLMGIYQCLMHTSQAKSRFMWQQFNSASNKIQLAQRLNWHEMKDEDLKKELDAALDAAETLNGTRNRYVHALWADPGGNSPALMRISGALSRNYKDAGMKHDLLTAEQIHDDANKVAMLSQTFSEWQSRYVTKFGAPI